MEDLPKKHPLGWIIRRLGVGTLLSVALLLITMGSVALGLTDVVRGLDAGLLLPVVACGVLMGWLLAKSPLAGWLGGVVALALGGEAVALRVGRLGGPLTAVLRSLAELAWGALRWPLDGPPDGATLSPAMTELGTDANTLLTRVRDWGLALIQGEATFDPVADALVWSLALWMAAVWAGWWVRRRGRPLQGIVPGGVLLAASLAYTGGNPHALLPVLGAIWLLLALTAHIRRERYWEVSGIDFSLDIRLDLALMAIFLSVTLVAAAMLTPSVSIRPIFESARRLMVKHLGEGTQLADSLGLESVEDEEAVFDRVRSAGLPRRHLIGSGPELSERVVMFVSTGEIAIDTAPPRFYWRSLTYDRYNGRGWRTGETETVEYRAGERADFGPTEGLDKSVRAPKMGHRTLRQEVKAAGDLGGLLYVAGGLITADHDYSVAWRAAGDAFGAQIPAATYRADSSVTAVSEAQLRTAGDDYPEGVRDRYLALPPEVPTRVLALARDLTATQPTGYERARAIESYLRGFPYTLDLPAPPPDREVTDYFLFDLQQGYCDYYATAMVVLARAAGLPARLVTGYASGTYDPISKRYVVTEADAHSWVEIYFPSYGWVEFEPTGGRPPIERPAENILAETPEVETPLQPLTGRQSRVGELLRLGLLGSLVSLGLGGLAWWVADGWRLWRQPPAKAVATLYRRLYRHGQRLAVPTEAGNTPYEFAADLIERVIELAQKRHSGAALTLISQQVRRLTDLYVQALYSPHEPDSVAKAQAIQTWRQLRQPLWLAWVWRKRRGIRGGA